MVDALKGGRAIERRALTFAKALLDIDDQNSRFHGEWLHCGLKANKHGAEDVSNFH